MKIIDISVNLREGMPIYEGDPAFCVKKHFDIEKDGCNVGKISIGTHTGTHIDAPFHYFKEGAKTDEIPLDIFIGECEVASDVCQTECSRVLWRDSKDKEFTLNAAQRILEKGVILIGTEALSIGNDEVHRELLSKGCIILENIDLSEVKKGKYTLVCQPLKINADGSPVRACLLEEEHE